MISIKKLNKGDVLAALYNGSKPQGLGFMHYDAEPMGRSEAESILEHQTYFDYLKGRVMKLDLSKDEFNPGLYDRDNGMGKAESIINELRNSGDNNTDAIKQIHSEGTRASATEVEKSMEEKIGHTYDESKNVIHLGVPEEAVAIIKKKIDLVK